MERWRHGSTPRCRGGRGQAVGTSSAAYERAAVHGSRTVGTAELASALGRASCWPADADGGREREQRDRA